LHVISVLDVATETEWQPTSKQPSDNVAPGHADVPQLPPSEPLDRAACVALFAKVRKQFEERAPQDHLDLRVANGQEAAFDALKWWKAADATTDLKKISHIARLVFATPASASAYSPRPISSSRNSAIDSKSTKSSNSRWFGITRRQLARRRSANMSPTRSSASSKRTWRGAKTRRRTRSAPLPPPAFRLKILVDSLLQAPWRLRGQARAWRARAATARLRRARRTVNEFRVFYCIFLKISMKPGRQGRWVGSKNTKGRVPFWVPG
jgi:hypothetical protein